MCFAPELTLGACRGDVCAVRRDFEVIRFKDAYSTRRLQLAFPPMLSLLLLISTAAFGQTPSLDRISCVTKTYSSSGTDTCRAFLTATNSTHLYIALSSNNSAVVVPSGVTVSYYAGSKGFAANIASVKTAQIATITAKLNGVAKYFKISLAPATSSSATMSVNATSIGFGSTVLNTPVAQSVTVSSTGTAALSVNSASVSGTGFTLSRASFPITLNPGQSTTLQLQFDPTTAGNYSGQLTVSSSASTKTIPLTGVGASHQVELSWIAPSATSDPIIGYNVYRSPSTSTSYVRLNGGTDYTTGYTDGTVQSGSSYKYIVKSVDSAGVESPASNATTVAVP
jgi:hypothetical protein